MTLIMDKNINTLYFNRFQFFYKGSQMTIIKQLLALLLIGLLLSCSGGGSASSSNEASFKVVTKDDKIMIAQKGRLQLQTIYKDSSGDIIEQGEEDKISVSFSTDKPDIAEVTKSGFLLGKTSGTTTLIATLKDGDSSFTHQVEVQVHPIVIESLYINPTISIFEEKGDSKDFTITATEKDGHPLKVFEEDISFEADKPALISYKTLFTR